MNETDPQILRQLREAAEQGLDSEAFYQAMRQAAHLGPMPRGLLDDVARRHFAEKMPKEGPVFTPEKEDRLRAGLRRFHEPSPRACDRNHPVGAAADAIRQALPEFRRWQVDIAHLNLEEMARRLGAGERASALSYLLPPGFSETSSGSYLTAERSLLIEDTDGSVVTMSELLERKTTRAAFHAKMREDSRLSDALGLMWKQPEPLELQTVEELLRALSEKVAPGVAVQFLPCHEPRFRAALRMQLGASPVPAATGGVLNRWSILPEGICVAAVTIHLEPWATARSGQTIDLAEGPAFPWREQPGCSQ